MPIKPTYPGVYIEEIPSGVRTIAGVSTSVTAFIDYFKYGPMDKAVQILSMGDFEREFGGLDSDSEASYAIQQFFLNGGSEAWVVRTASDTPDKPLKKSGVKILSDIHGTVALTVEAISEGSWGNNLKIKIDYNAIAPELFNMSISEFKNIQGIMSLSRSETFSNLSMNRTNPRHVETVVNDEDSGSRLIRVRTNGDARPLQNGTVSGVLTAPVVLTDPKPVIKVTIGDEDTAEAVLDTRCMEKSSEFNDLNDVRALLERAIRSSKPENPAFAAATVELSQNRLRILAGPTSESSTITFSEYVNPTLNELKLDSPDSVKGVISGDPRIFPELASAPALKVKIGDVEKEIDFTKPTSLDEARTALEKAIHDAGESTDLAFKNARVSVYDIEKKLIILAGLPNSDVSFKTTAADNKTLNQLKLDPSSLVQVKGAISGNLNGFSGLSATTPSLEVSIDGVKKEITFTKPTSLNEARTALEKAIREADSTEPFKKARVSVYDIGTEKRLIILAGIPNSEISFKETDADDSTLTQLKLDSSSIVPVKGVISGDPHIFPELTSTPSLKVKIGTDETEITFTKPTNLDQARTALEEAIHNAPAESFKKARVSVYDTDTEKKLIILAGLPDLDVSFDKTTADSNTLTQLKLNSPPAVEVKGVISGNLTTTFPKLTAPCTSVNLKIGTEDPHTVTFKTKPTNFDKARLELETAIREANPGSDAFKSARVALHTKDDERRLIIAFEKDSTNAVFTARQYTTAEKLGLTVGGGMKANVQEYKLGNDSLIQQTAQGEGVSGGDGVPPDGKTLLGGGDSNQKKGLYALKDVDLFNILCIPRTSIVSGDNALSREEAYMVLNVAKEFCKKRRAFFIVDPPNNINDVQKIKEWADGAGIRDKNTALYFPRIKTADPLDEFRLRSFGASGTIAGLYARTDSSRGVWKAPAGTEAALVNVQALDYKLTDGENGTLNPLAINCLRNFPIYGNICWGARTLDGADQKSSEWKYIPIRRLALFLEESLYRGTQWVVFEPNDEPLWAQIRLNIGAFMHSLFRQGAFQGQTPKEAYFVKCDKETTTQTDINSGIVNIVVGFAPLKPAEFVIIQIQQMAGQIQV